MRKLLLLSALLLFLVVPQAHAWYYHMQINVTETSGANLTNYPVSFYMDTEQYVSQGLLRSDCADFMFIINGSEVPYIVEDCNTNNSKIWFLVPYLPASSTVVVDVYFGDPTVYNAYSPSDIFPYYNDFESADDVANFTGLTYVTNITYHGQGAALKTLEGLVCTQNDTFNLSQDFIVEAYIYAPNDGVSDEVLIMNNSNFGYGAGVVHTSNAFTTYRYYPYPTYTGGSVTMSADPIGVWTKRIMVFRAGSVYGAVYDLSGNLLSSNTLADNLYKPYTKLCFSNVGFYTDYRYYIDYVVVRPYATSEPQLNVSSPEQLFLAQYIDRCGDIALAGEYFLNASLYFGDAVTASSPFDFQYCIRILADNVTINCLGKSIVGNGTILYNVDASYKPMVAVGVINSDNVKIINCNVFNATYPLRAENSSISVSGLKTDAGVFVKNTTITISDSTFYGIDFNLMKSKIQECGFTPQSDSIIFNVWNPDLGGLVFPRCARYWVFDWSVDSSNYKSFPIPPHIGAAGSNVYISRSSFYGNAPSIVSNSINLIVGASTLVPVKTSDLSVLDSSFEINYLSTELLTGDASIINAMHTTLSVVSNSIRFSGGYHLLPDPLNPIPYLPRQLMDYTFTFMMYSVASYNETEFRDNNVYGVNIVLKGYQATVVNNEYGIFPYFGYYIPYDGSLQTSSIYNNFYGLYSCADLLNDNGGALPCPPYYIFGNEVNITNNDTITYDKSPSEICVDADKDGVCDKPFVFSVSPPTVPEVSVDATDTAPYSYYYINPPLTFATGTVVFRQVAPNFEEEIKQKIVIIPRYLKVYIPKDKDYGSVEFQVINNGDRELYFYFGASSSIEDYVKSPKLGRYFYIPPNSGRKFTFIVDGYNKTESTYGSLILYADFPEQMVKIPIRVEITREAPQEEIAWVLIPIIIILLLVAL